MPKGGRVSEGFFQNMAKLPAKSAFFETYGEQIVSKLGVHIPKTLRLLLIWKSLPVYTERQ